MMQSFGSIHPQLSQLPSRKKSSPRHGNKRGAGGAARTAHTAAGPFESGPERSAAVLGCSIANCHRATGSNATRAAPCAWLRANSARGAAHAGLEPDNAGTRRQRANIWNVSQRVSVTRSPRSEAPGQTRRAAGTRIAAQGINSGGRELRGMRRAGNGAGPRGVLPGRARKSGAARPASRSPPCPDGIPRGHRPGPARRRAGPPRGRAAGEAPRDRRGGRRRASRADAQRKAARDRPRCIGGWGREGGSGTRAGLTHAAAATHRSFARCRLLPTAPPRPIPALGGSRGRGQWDGGPQGGALLLAGGGGGPPRAAAMAGSALAALLPAVLRPRGCTHVCQRGERGVWRRGEPVPAEAPVWDAERLRGITARVNLVLSVWGYCEIIASPG